MLQEMFAKTYYGNTVQEWAIAFSIILGAIIVGKILYWISTNVFKKLASKTETKLDDLIVDMLEEPAVFALTLVGAWYALGTLTFTEGVQTGIWNFFQVLIIANIAWFLTRFFDAICKEYLFPLADQSETDLDDQLLPLLSKGIKIIIWCIAIIVALNNAGYNVGALIAGLGIGGLAFAMAAKDTIANIFGGFTIITDKPFTIKDRIKVSGYDGGVEEIGLRSTRVRTLEGRLVTIPNATFAENPVENVSWEPTRKVVLNLGLTYDTTPQKMQKAMQILEGIATKHEGVTKDYKIAFNAFGDSALGILFIYYIKKKADILKTQTEMNMTILKEFNKNRLDFAYPTQTIFTKKG